MKTFPFFIVFLCLTFMPRWAHAQLNTSPSGNATLLANTLVGPGISVSNATILCPPGASGTFSNGGSTNIGLDDGVLLASGLISNAIGPNIAPNTTTAFGTAGDADLSALSGFATFDACVLEFDFEAVADLVSISYVFASEEYQEYVNSPFNDVFGFLVSGPNPAGGSYTNQNIATIPVNVPVAVNTVNHLLNSTLYVDNPQGGGTTIEYDGFTVKLTATLAIVPCATYHFKLAIADASDLILDSGVFLEEASFQADLQCQDITITLDGDGTKTISADDLVASDIGICDFSYTASQTYFVCSDEGENTVTVTADDGMGTVLTCQATVTVVVPEGILSIDYGPDCRQVYLGYGPAECTDLTANVTGGTAPYTYEWSTGETTQTITVCPGATTDYYVTVTDANGCTEVAGPIQVLVVDVSCGNNGNKVMVCHIPPGNPGNLHTICISADDVPDHLGHGDFLGDCSVTADPCTQPYIAFPDVDVDLASFDEPTLSPNPGNDEIRVGLPDGLTGPVRIELRSSQGGLLRALDFESTPSQIRINDISALTAGVYHVMVREANGSLWNLKWVKFE